MTSIWNDINLIYSNIYWNVGSSWHRLVMSFRALLCWRWRLRVFLSRIIWNDVHQWVDMRVCHNSRWRSVERNLHNDTDAYFITMVCNIAVCPRHAGGLSRHNSTGTGMKMSYLFLNYWYEIHYTYSLSVAAFHLTHSPIETCICPQGLHPCCTDNARVAQIMAWGLFVTKLFRDPMLTICQWKPKKQK